MAEFQQNATVTQVAASATVVTLLAESKRRVGGTVYNSSSSILYLKLGSAASATSFTVRCLPEDYYEIPFGYNGIVTGIWVSATGYAYVTDIV